MTAVVVVVGAVVVGVAVVVDVAVVVVGDLPESRG